jgi:drug/metabolite transporter (DMT)-like permease
LGSIVSVEAFVLIVSAAVLHAVWNLVVKGSDDRLGSMWAVATAGAIVNVPVLMKLGLPEVSVMGWLLLSAILHVGYGYALAGAYDRVDLAVAYPIARGTAPLIVTVLGIALLGDTISFVGIAGIVLVASSLAIIGLRHVPSGVGWALLTGIVIAAYTVADGAGVRAGDESVRYIGALFVLHSAAFTTIMRISRGSFESLHRVIRRSPGQLLVGGAASAGAYLLVMIAARSTPLGLVAGLRETSAGFGVLAGYLVLGERVTRLHAAAVMVALAGSILIATS